MTTKNEKMKSGEIMDNIKDFIIPSQKQNLKTILSILYFSATMHIHPYVFNDFDYENRS